jgi:hypothetical protein
MANMLLAVKWSVHRVRTGLIHGHHSRVFLAGDAAHIHSPPAVRAPANCRSLVIVSVEITTTR